MEQERRKRRKGAWKEHRKVKKGDERRSHYHEEKRKGKKGWKEKG